MDLFKEKSLHGYSLDVLISALQKSIRRGHEDLAIRVATELMATSPELEDYVWHRLLVICAEDIGKGNYMATVIVKSLYDSSLLLSDGQAESDRRILLVHAIRFLCAQDKDRSSALHASIAKRECLKNIPIEFPDYVYDLHTLIGQNMGRGYEYFLQESSKVFPDINKEEVSILKERLRTLLKEE